MAQDIVPIELGLPQGDLVTLWAPRWREDGEEWEAFLGHEDDLYAFPDAAHLAAFVRTVENGDGILQSSAASRFRLDREFATPSHVLQNENGYDVAKPDLEKPCERMGA